MNSSVYEHLTNKHNFLGCIFTHDCLYLCDCGLSDAQYLAHHAFNTSCFTIRCMVIQQSSVNKHDLLGMNNYNFKYVS